MNYFKYIVPIFTSKESKDEPSPDDYCGTGFIVGNYLITAGHVVYGFKYVWYKFDGRFYLLPKFEVCELGRYEENRYNRIDKDMIIKEDLAIVEIGDCDSPLKFGIQDEDMSCVYHGYSFKDGAIKEDHINIDLNIKRDKFINCKYSKYLDFVSGNSGGPIFNGDCIVGMLVSNVDTKEGERYGCCCIVPWYIQCKINKY